MVQAMTAWAVCIAGYERFPFAKLNLHDKWNDQDKMERQCSIETTFQSHRNDPFAFRPKFWLLLSKVGLKTKIFGNGRGSFGRTGPTVQEDHLWRWTTLTGKFLHRPIYFWTEISETFVIMESNSYYSWCLKDEAFRAEPSGYCRLYDLYLHSLSRLQMRPSSFRLETRQVLVSVLS